MIIASTYEIVRELGSGGGGVIFLAHHMRLGKDVVLKADKRPMVSGLEQLRHEADALKNLSHTYIPQVYDFVEEDGRVFTVMDFIEGESFDKLLARGVKFTQPQIINWARELLDALVYLHSRPPHGILHADIKPANIMLTLQGDIRLIDFNIALALGEEGAVAVGRSQGYASPEHYGTIFPDGNRTEQIEKTVKVDTEIIDKTELIDNIESANSDNSQQESDSQLLSRDAAPASVIPSERHTPNLSYTASKKTVILDVRSDIYSLGATLYHLITGRRPAGRSVDVVRLTETDGSPAFIEIINKAMHPDPASRFQTAREMLEALNHLHDNDQRTRRFRRARKLAAISIILLFLLSVSSTFAGLRRMERTQAAYALAEYSKIAFSEGDVLSALSLALEALPEQNSIFIPPYTAQAQKALTDALGVYDLSDGYKPHMTVTSPGEVINITVSPDGTVIAALTLGKLTVFDADTGEKLCELPIIDSALADVIFIGNNTIVYAGIDGITAYDLAAKQELWRGSPATTISVSDDGSTIAAIYRDDSAAVIYDVSGSVRKTVSFGERHLQATRNDRLYNPKGNVFSLNSDGSLLAVSFSGGGLEIFDLNIDDNDIEIMEESEYTHYEGGFNGVFFLFSATNSSESLFATINVKTMEQADGFIAPERVGVEANESGVYLTFRDKYIKYDPVTLEESDPNYDKELPPYDFQYSIDSATVQILKLVSNADKEIFKYDSFYDHDEARISGDGKTVMLFSINGFRLYKISGEIIAEVKFENNIYDQQYHRIDGQSFLEVIFYDGSVQKYSASDGTLIAEEHIAPPNESLYEEFYTDSFKITAPLHGAATVFDLVSGKQICRLETDAYLTYVTQCGELLVTEYVSVADDLRFGLLLDCRTCETLAKLPYLCDVIGDRLIFDIHPGSIRETSIFSIEELIEIANAVCGPQVASD